MRRAAAPRHAACAGAIAFALLGAPAAAHALPGAIGACGGNSYALCLNLTDFAFGTGANGMGANQLRLTVANATAAAYAPATLRTFLISGLGGAYGVSSLVASTGTYAGVSSETHANVDNGYTGVGYDDSPQPNFVGWDNTGNSGLAAGRSATFTFTFTRNIVQSDFVVGDAFAPSVQFVAHARGASSAIGALCGGTSSKAVFDADGDPLMSGATLPGCLLEGDGARLGAGGPGAVVPEPGTLVLLGSGIVGVVVVARRRRGA